MQRLSLFPDIEIKKDVRWVDEGHIVTAAGISAGIDMSLHYHWRKGTGRSLCKWAENTLSIRGYKQITLWVFADNIQSRKFYETIGYLLDGASKILNIGKLLQAVRYLKTLQ